MALIDYKIVKFSHTGRHVSAIVRLYRGTMQDVSTSIEGVATIENRYVRTLKIAEKTFEYDVPRDMTRAEFIIKVRAYLNQKIQDFATARGHTVVPQQQDVSENEPVSNELET